MLFSSLHRHVLRNGLWLMILVIFFVLGLFVGQAFAAEPQKKEVLLEALPTKPIITTTTTTTTSPPTTTTTTLPIVAPTTTPPPVKTQPVAPSGDWVAQCHAWASEAGMTLSPSAISLIDKESDCNPTIWNKAGSGAGGIPQALPASKMGCTMNYDSASATCQLRWMESYVNGRYGSWEEALSFWHCIGYCRGIHKTSTWY